MSWLHALPFAEIWVIDFEFRVPDGERISAVHCLCALEVRSGRRLKLWADELVTGKPPFDTGPDSLFVAYVASAEVSAFLHLAWQPPARLLDLYAEFRNRTNDDNKKFTKASLVTAMAFYGLRHDFAEEKADMRDIAIRGGPFTPEEKLGLLEYCWSDVEGTAALLGKMLPDILERAGVDPRTNLAHALRRGQYMAAVARMEYTGIPIDGQLLNEVRANWRDIRLTLLTKGDADLGLYVGGSFNTKLFEAYLARQGLLNEWPRSATGKVLLQAEVFDRYAIWYPETIGLIKDLRASLAELRSIKIPVDPFNRSRCWLNPFVSITGRNQPPSSKFVYGPARWLRSFIMAPPGKILVYLDYSAQEIAIAAALSGDEALKVDYAADPYLAFAKRIGLAPPDATKHTHAKVRDEMKTIYLGINYGMSAEGMAARLNITPADTRRMMSEHRRLYPAFWKWSAGALETCQTIGRLSTTLGWQLIGPVKNGRTAMNWPMQAGGAEILRLACTELIAAGYTVCAPIHDAILLEVDADQAEAQIAGAVVVMEKASRAVLGGYTVRVGGQGRADWVMPGQRYSDPRGAAMWQTVMETLGRLRAESTK